LREVEITGVNGEKMTFTCLETPQTCVGDINENVLMIHGWPERKEFFHDFMMDLADKNYCGLACDMHGYSPGAAPAEKISYQSDTLRDESFKIARGAGFSKFHLICHDHGAVLGWRMAASTVKDDLKMIQSYSALSNPHNDVLSKALLGTDADMNQQVSSQYFSVFIQPGSVSLKVSGDKTLFELWKCKWGHCFETAADFQKTMYWYNGLFEDSAVLSMPPDYDVETIQNSTSPGKERAIDLRRANPDLTGTGIAQEKKVGEIKVPTLFICGSQDTSLLCATDLAKTTKDMVASTAGYQYLEVECGHRLTTCDEPAETKKVHDGILAHLLKYKYKQRVAGLQEEVV